MVGGCVAGHGGVGAVRAVLAIAAVHGQPQARADVGLCRQFVGRPARTHGEVRNQLLVPAGRAGVVYGQAQTAGPAA